jgi:hypothetical protein
MSGKMAMGRRSQYRLRRSGDFRLVIVERNMTTTAQIVVGPKLDKLATVASHDLPCIHGS